jgi:NitT/TauT family transport system permease protein
MTLSRWRPAVSRGVIVLAVVIVVWELSIRLFAVPAYIVPTPWAVTVALIANARLLFTNLAITFEAIIAGWFLAIIVGVLIAIAIVQIAIIERIFYPILVLWQGIPKIAVAPLFVVWFGFGMTTRVFIAFIVGLFAMIVSTVAGLRSSDTDVIDLARVVRATRLQTLLHFTLPNALPAIFSGLRITCVQACSGAVVAEFVGSNSGIGYLLMVAIGNFELPLMFAALVLLALTGLLLFLVVDVAEHFCIPWHASQRNTRSHFVT